ncbi:MAG TPA: tetratricopeptide repeat protein [Pseudogracilibacillus sp.]|nr:tetratricopeptide repeat protein [Pseudogracilibacillus sp.]
MKKLEEIMQLMEIGEVDNALQLLTEYLKTATDDEKFTVSELYAQFGFFEEAVEILNELLKKYGQEGQIITKLAELYIELEKDDLAIELLNSVPEDDPFYVPTLLNLADLYEAQGLFEVSEQKLFAAKEIFPDEIIIDYALAELLFSIGKMNRAIPFYEKVLTELDHVNEVSIEERLAESYAMIGQYEKALAHYSQMNSKDPDSLFKYGMTAYQQKRHELAIQVWKELLELDPYYHTAYVELANVQKEAGMTVEAYETIQKGLHYDDYDKAMYLLAGQLAAQLNNLSEAIEYFEQAIALDADYQEAILSLVALYRKEDNEEAIVQLLEQDDILQNEEPIYYWELAKAHNELENYQQAKKYYDDAYVYLTHDGDFLKEYGYFLLEEGMQTEAIHVLQKYIKIDPLDEEVIQLIERINDANFD